MTTASLLWDHTLGDLRAKLDEESFATWLEPVQFVDCQDGVVTLSVPSVFYRNWLANNYQEQIQDSLEQRLQHDITLHYVIREQEAETPLPESLSAAEQRAMELLRRQNAGQGGERGYGLVSGQGGGNRQSSVGRPEVVACPLNRNYNFENFVVGESNRFAYAAAQAVADPHSRAYNPLFIYGGVGLGKTHLMQAIGHELMSYGQHFRVLYVSSEAFMNAFIEAVAQKKLIDFRNCFRNVDLLLVDDVQFFSGAEQTQTEFFHTFNVLFDAGKKIVISSDHPPKELHELEERLRSRFEWGLIVDIQPPDLETRLAILRRKARAIGLDLNPEVTMFIAERIRSNLRKLEGALTRLSAHHAMNHKPISVELARTLLGPFVGSDEPRQITIEKIQMTICDYFSMSLHDMTGPNRQKKFARPRQLAAYLSRELTESSFPEIARKFGGRDHTSILHAHKKVKHEMALDLNLQNTIKYIVKMIKEDGQLERGS